MPATEERRFFSWRWQAAKLRELGLPRWLWKALVQSLYLPVGLVLRWAGVRLVVVSPFNRIGHLSLDVDCYLKEGLLGLRPAQRAIVTSDPREDAANAAMVGYWSRHLPVLVSRPLRRLIFPLTRFRWLTHDVLSYQALSDVTAKAATIQRQWGSRPPLLSLTEADRVRGRDALLRLGLPPDAWFVCVHAREGGYSQHDEPIHSYRNCDIHKYLLAAQEIVARGGWCVRMGDATMQRLPPLPGVVDYAHSPLKSDWLDVFLCASARFFIGSTSGLHFVSGAFGVPAAEANLTPISAALPLLPGSIGIPKLVRSLREGRLLAFREVLDSPAAAFRRTEEYARAGLILEENSPEDIRDLALELLDRIEGRAQYDSEDERRQALFQGILRPGHYSYGAASRVGRDFLRKHAPLLNSSSIVAARR